MAWFLFKEPLPDEGFRAVRVVGTDEWRRFASEAEAVAFAEAEPDFRAAAYIVVREQGWIGRSFGRQGAEAR